MNGVDNSVETVNAAATAIITANSRVQQVTSPRRRWGGCFSMHWCFGSQRQDKRVNHSSFGPEVRTSELGHVAPEIPIQPPAPVLPFVAPPSSPASFLQSDPSSAIHSPVGLLSLSALSAEAYSPGGPNSIFAIGPYAHETQLVSPPVFSTFTTEPSTAPLTPPEPVHFTSPSSPEVPFAELLMSSLDSTLRKSEGQGFQTYQLYPGSPIGNLISPSSVCSGTSSPFPDPDIHSSINGTFPHFPVADPPKLLTAERLSMRKQFSLHPPREDGSLVDDHTLAPETTQGSTDKTHVIDPLLGQRVSFDLSNGNDTYSGEKSETSEKPSTDDPHLDIAESVDSSLNKVGIGRYVDESYHDLPEKLKLSPNAQASKEFKFDNVEGSPTQPTVGSDWWSNEDVSHTETSTSKNWAFFHTKQPGIS